MEQTLHWPLMRGFFRIEQLVEQMESRQHSSGCHADDLEGHGACNCGASKHNNLLRKIKHEIEKINNMPVPRTR